MICWDGQAEGRKLWLGMVDKAVDKLTEHIDEFDALIAVGFSGNMVAAPVALRIDKPVVMVRDENSKHVGGSHGWYEVESGARLVFIDDHISGGKTVQRVQSLLKERWGSDRNKEMIRYYHTDCGYGMDWIRENYPYLFEERVIPLIVATYLYNDVGYAGRLNQRPGYGWSSTLDGTHHFANLFKEEAARAAEDAKKAAEPEAKAPAKRTITKRAPAKAVPRRKPAFASPSSAVGVTMRTRRKAVYR